MRWLPAVACAFVIVVSGCLNAKDPDAGTQSVSGDGGCTTSGNATTNVTCSATLSSGPRTSSHSGTRGPTATGNTTTTGNATGNSTASGNATGNATENATAGPVGVVLQESFSGLLPVDGLQGIHDFAIPAGGVKLVVVYTSDHVGLFGAVLAVTDPSGARKMYSLEDCASGLDPPAAVTVCEMTLEEELALGDWTATVSWQVGEATEDYTVDVTAYGRL